MLQRWWFQAMGIFCIITSSLTLRLDLRQRRVRHLRPWLKILVYVPIISGIVLIPFTLVETFENAHQYLSNPVIIYANNVTALARIVLFLIVVLTMHRRDEHLTKWLEEMLGWEGRF